MAINFPLDGESSIKSVHTDSSIFRRLWQYIFSTSNSWYCWPWINLWISWGRQSIWLRSTLHVQTSAASRPSRPVGPTLRQSVTRPSIRSCATMARHSVYHRKRKRHFGYWACLSFFFGSFLNVRPAFLVFLVTLIRSVPTVHRAYRRKWL